MKPIFLLGVGAQKAGTSWLHNMISGQSFSNMGFTKEYHIWDAKFSELGKNFLVNQQSSNVEPQIRGLMQKDDEAYVQYFKGLMKVGVHLTGDMTPSYSLLDANALLYIKNLLENAYFEVKVIFLMRDPAERIWSSEKMYQRVSAEEGNAYGSSRLKRNFEKALDCPQSLERTNYRSTIRNLELVFSPHSIHYEIYEDLFTKEAIRRLEDFLGIGELKSVNFSKKINSSNLKELPTRLRRKAIEVHRSQYEYCFERFPKTKNFWKTR